MVKSLVLVGGVITQDQSILVLQRSPIRVHFPNHWELPGGKVEFGEHPEHAIVREVVEETGLSCKIIGQPFHVFTSVIQDQHIIQLNYLVSCSDLAEPVLSDHQGYRWMDRESSAEPMTAEIRETLDRCFDLINSDSPV